jgi:hypothetical protein
MALKEQVANHPVVWFLGALVAGFSAGLGAYQGILEIAGLDVISEERLAQVESIEQDTTSSAPNSNVTLEAEWINLNTPQPILSAQVLIEPVQVQEALREAEIALDVPGRGADTLHLRVGDRASFDFQGQGYWLYLLSVDASPLSDIRRVQLTVARKLGVEADVR